MLAHWLYIFLAAELCRCQCAQLPAFSSLLPIQAAREPILSPNSAQCMNFFLSQFLEHTGAVSLAAASAVS
jgi:hypothetical protein